LGERELCKLEVVGSIPIGSTILRPLAWMDAIRHISRALFDGKSVQDEMRCALHGLHLSFFPNSFSL
jgi:hypothetical protein